MKMLLNVSLYSLLFFGCASENQKKSLDRIAAVYETEANFSKGIIKNSGKATINYFKVIVTSNEFIEKLIPQVASTNMALLVYDGLTESERAELTHIEIEIKATNNAGEGNQRRYTMEELESPHLQAKLFHQFSEKLKMQAYDDMIAMIDAKLIKAEDVDFVKKHINEYVSVNGKIKEFRRIGVGMRLRENGEKRYEFSGLLIFENNKRVNYSIQTYLEASNQKIFGFHID